MSDIQLGTHHMSLVLWLDLSCPLPRRFRRRNSVRQSDVSVGTWGEKSRWQLRIASLMWATAWARPQLPRRQL